MKHLISMLLLLSACAVGSNDPPMPDGGPVSITEVACTAEGEACQSNTECCQSPSVLICASTATDAPTCMTICVEDADCCVSNSNDVCGTCRAILGQIYGVCD